MFVIELGLWKTWEFIHICRVWWWVNFGFSWLEEADMYTGSEGINKKYMNFKTFWNLLGEEKSFRVMGFRFTSLLLKSLMDVGSFCGNLAD
jgi:hypothetical protein